jgi:hypothetical protein
LGRDFFVSAALEKRSGKTRFWKLMRIDGGLVLWRRFLIIDLSVTGTAFWATDPLDLAVGRIRPEGGHWDGNNL